MVNGAAAAKAGVQSGISARVQPTAAGWRVGAGRVTPRRTADGESETPNTSLPTTHLGGSALASANASTVVRTSSRALAGQPRIAVLTAGDSASFSSGTRSA